MLWTVAVGVQRGQRDEQEDSFVILPEPTKDNCLDKEFLLVVADGMGGQKNGKLASQEVINVAQTVWRMKEKYLTISPTHLLKVITEKAHSNIRNLGKEINSNMGSTCVLLYVKEKQAWWSYVGDSRLYHIRQRKLLVRTQDHSVVQMLFDMGRISEVEMLHHQDRGRLLKNLGKSGNIEPEYGFSKLKNGDSFILCTDGFWEYISLNSMIAGLNQTRYPMEVVAAGLAKRAVKKGKEDSDNTTLIIVKSATHFKMPTNLLDNIFLFVLAFFIFYLIYILF